MKKTVLMSLVFVVAWLSGAAIATETVEPKPLPLPDSPEVTRFLLRDMKDLIAQLKKRPDVTFVDGPEWITARDPLNSRVYLFSRPGVPGHPAGVKRSLVRDSSGLVRVMTAVACRGTQTVCDGIMNKFHTTDAEMKKEMKEQLQGP